MLGRGWGRRLGQLICCIVMVFGLSVVYAAGFEQEIVAAAKARTKASVTYDGRYIAIAYPGGDVPSNIGVCTDVIQAAEADALFVEYLDFYKSAWCLFPECLEALERLSVHCLGIISNGDPTQQREKLKALKIDHYFEYLVTPEDVGAAKLSAEIFEHAAALAGLKACQCWYVGDDYDKDYLAAKHVNWNAVWLKRDGAETPEEHCCRSLLAFAQLVS